MRGRLFQRAVGVEGGLETLPAFEEVVHARAEVLEFDDGLGGVVAELAREIDDPAIAARASQPSRRVADLLGDDLVLGLGQAPEPQRAERELVDEDFLVVGLGARRRRSRRRPGTGSRRGLRGGARRPRRSARASGRCGGRRSCPLRSQARWTSGRSRRSACGAGGRVMASAIPMWNEGARGGRRVTGRRCVSSGEGSGMFWKTSRLLEPVPGRVRALVAVGPANGVRRLRAEQVIELVPDARSHCGEGVAYLSMASVSGTGYLDRGVRGF